MTTKTKKTSKKQTPAAKPVAKAAPKAPPAPAAKPEPTPAAAPKAASKREVIPGDAKITVLAKENPRRPGTLAHKTFGIYRTGMTVAEWREACRGRDADPGYLHADIAAGHIAAK